jgi:hypothetical protein
MKKFIPFKASLLSVVLLIMAFFQNGISQNLSLRDTSFESKTPILVNASTLFSTKSMGFHASLEKYLVQKEIHKMTKSGKTAIVKKDRLLSLDLGYYFQDGLHHNWFLTSSYTLKRTERHGFYATLSPMLGVSRTFLTEETYAVDNNGGISVDKFAGTWYLFSGFNMGVGKTFKEEKNFILKDVYAKLFFQVLYPNFGFISFKPSIQIGTSLNINKIERHSKKIIKFKKR